MSNAKSSIALADLTLSQAHLELRTTPKFALWDRSGTIWTDMLDKYPRLSFIQAEPNKTVFTLDKKYSFSIFIDNASSVPHTTILSTAYKPSPALKELGEIANTFIKIAQDNLLITDYYRLGLRLIYIKDYPDGESASQALLSTNLLKVPEVPIFSVKGAPASSEYYVRIEEKDKKGVSIRLKIEGFTYDFDPPLEWHDVEGVHKKVNRLVYDVDHYTLGTVAIGQLNTIEWISQTRHVLHRDSDKMLRGV